MMKQEKEKGPQCPKCGSGNTIWYGWAKGKKQLKHKFYCNSCLTFGSKVE